MCKTEQYQFEELLAYHCAPTLKGYKIANMFHVSRTLFPCAEEIILEYNEKFRQKGLTFCILQAERPRITFYLYSIDSFIKILKQEKIRVFLERLGYPTHSPTACLDFLEKRMEEATYPHEIGIFLGYPLEDVLGFIQNKPCCCMGAWKVYDQNSVSRCKELFSLFEYVRNQFIRGVENGCRIEQLMETQA